VLFGVVCGWMSVGFCAGQAGCRNPVVLGHCGRAVAIRSKVIVHNIDWQSE
jgi:hypothetical protein